MTITKHLYLPGYLLLLALLMACNSKEGNPASPAETQAGADEIRISAEQFKEGDMLLGNPSERAFGETLEVSGVLDVPPENRVVISAVQGGFVKSITLLVGDKVRQGQQVVSLENPEFLQLQQQYLETREQIPYKEAEYRRQKTLFEEKISSEKLFLQAEGDYRSSLARLNGLGSQLELLNFSLEAVESGNLSAVSPVFSPISGSVTRVNVRKGAYVSPASEIMEIVDKDHLHLELTVYEKDVTRLHKGQPIRFGLPELSEQQYDARVYLIGTSIDENRTVKVHAHLEEESKPDFLVGMFVRASIELGDTPGKNTQNQLLSLPESAIVTKAGQSWILILEEQLDSGYRLRQMPVVTGLSSGGFIAVEGEGLSPRSSVLIRGAFNLVEAP